MTRNAAKPFSEGCSVTMLASGTDLGAAAHRIPGSIRPLDLGNLTHRTTPPRLLACQAVSTGMVLVSREKSGGHGNTRAGVGIQSSPRMAIASALDGDGDATRFNRY